MFGKSLLMKNKAMKWESFLMLEMKNLIEVEKTIEFENRFVCEK
jgi:hypothetical protein